jgi:hypothetical protein
MVDENPTSEGTHDGPEPVHLDEVIVESNTLLEQLRTMSEESSTLVARIKECSDEAESHSEASAGHEETAETNAKYTSVAKSQVEQLEKELQSIRSEAKSHLQQTSDLSVAAVELEETIEADRERLDKLTSRCENLQTQIEALLPGATGAGLAKAFSDRKKDFGRPRLLWTALSVLSILAVVLVGLAGQRGFLELIDIQELSWGPILEGLLMRLPVAGPLVWLAVYAGRHQLIASRIEEDYAYKEAVSRAFEGYKREMGAIDEIVDDANALTTLCSNVLRTLSVEPGRMYVDRPQDFTPLNTVFDAITPEHITAVAKMTGVEGDAVSKVLQAFTMNFRR